MRTHAKVTRTAPRESAHARKAPAPTPGPLREFTPEQAATTAAKLAARSVPTPGPLPTPCHLWQGAINRNGYGLVCVNGRMMSTSRAAHLAHLGPIPDDPNTGATLQVSQRCRNRACVNPDHLETITRAEKNRRTAAAITHCPAGHEYTEANTRVTVDKHGHQDRTCRTCARRQSAESLARPRPRITPELATQIKSCKGVYTAHDTIAHFGIPRSTVYRLWSLTPDDHDLESPNIWHTKVTNDLIVADTQILLDRGWTLPQVAAHFGVTPARVRAAHQLTGTTYRIDEHAGEFPEWPIAA